MDLFPSLDRAPSWPHHKPFALGTAGHEESHRRAGSLSGAREGPVTFYVEVPDVEAALTAAERLGGLRTMGPDEVPEGPMIGMFQDPEGHAIRLIQSA